MNRKDLARAIQRLRGSGVRGKVDSRLRQFRELHQMEDDHWFSELCFCILTANSSATIGLRIQEHLGIQGFKTLPKEELTNTLAALGHRFPKRRAEFIVGARAIPQLKGVITGFAESREAREWLKRNVKGLGLKEASHFLRNVGYFDLAILDRHVQKVMLEHGLIDKLPKTMTRRRYLTMEATLEKFAKEVKLPLGELDLYLWYMKTGKILK